ncbi:hypothetical protein CERZMDRAFT_68391 [Cercospora zeae-maydis SCOH1-5]|uniref:Bifunctional cytochrome P450/NADPH--P450 reductase n=1 Tax=Cercospora zeae-maydis SCOH1-5 TaxID=717836 RepID=A0A6A6FDY8_9PEZI|nr:hypothetical protein CERZMDRAFT_68391 [Cercospora zeae-maydis SCOH1-5]
MSCPVAAHQPSENGCPITKTHRNHDEKPESSASQLEEIPQPPPHLFGLLGNIPDVDFTYIFKDVTRLQQIYGPIIKLQLAKEIVFVGNQALANEVCDTKRFNKAPSPSLEEARAFLGDALFSAYNEEVNWGKAHRMLIPTFGPFGVRKMWGGMQDIASQMILKWDRLGPDHEIECADDLTRLAFDTIGLCAFSYRFNQFYSEDVHPFAMQMADVLVETGKKSGRPHLIQALYRRSERKRLADMQSMHALCDQIVADRKQHPQPDNNDLLNVMLNSTDRETGEGLSDENIRFQLTTFLVAGHETTSATLGFTYYHLLKHPGVLLKAQKLVDEVVGDEVLSLEHVPKLEYIDACIKETLRLTPPVGGFTIGSKTDQVVGGKYLVPANTLVTVNNTALHRDPAVWGEDADEYRPERWLNGVYAKLPPNSWKPFGNGVRACIGRGFAEQEMIMNVAMVLQRFQIELADPSYELQIKSTITIKPHNFRIKVKRRQGKSTYVGIPGGAQMHDEKNAPSKVVQPAQTKQGKPLAIYFGGNSGTCEALAQSLETVAKDRGFDTSFGSLDSATEDIPTDRPAVFITSSYEGLPPDNAKKFVKWLEGLKQDSQPLADVKYAVFGAGNSDWASTFQQVPKFVDAAISKAGGTRILDIGTCNVKKDLIGPWDEWLDKLMTILTTGDDTSCEKQEPTLKIAIQRRRTGFSDETSKYGTIMANKELAGTEMGPAKRHIEVQLPEDTPYTAGDYLVVQPRNSLASVQRITKFFGLNEQDVISFSGSSKKFLPQEPTSVREFLSSAVELATPITKRQLDIVSRHTPADKKDALSRLIDNYDAILEKRYSVIDVLEEVGACVPFEQYVDMLQALASRQYSISSSPLANPDALSLTIDVFESPALSGHGIFHGVASTYLASRRIGDRISCFVRATQIGFRLPQPKTPLIMFAAGTGIAPMRAFLQERSAIAQAQGVDKLGPAVLYFGCRHRDKDYIYRDELEKWEKQGIVKVLTAFSKMDDAEHPRYVPDLIVEHRDELSKMFVDGGKVFLCGSAARLGKSVSEACVKLYAERRGTSLEEAEKWLQEVKTDRYVSDVY